MTSCQKTPSSELLLDQPCPHGHFWSEWLEMGYEGPKIISPSPRPIFAHGCDHAERDICAEHQF